MTIDANRASFIKKEYRWDVKEDTAVKARDNTAREEEFSCNVDPTTASQLGPLILAQNNTDRIFTVSIDGVMTLEDFLTGVPRYIPVIPKYGTDGRTYRVLSFTTDLNKGITTAKVHG